MIFFKYLFIFLLVMWLIGLIIKGAVSSWLQKRTEEYNRAARRARKEAERSARSHHEGDVTIDAPGRSAPKKVSGNVGEYVEFEELDSTGGDKR